MKAMPEESCEGVLAEAHRRLRTRSAVHVRLHVHMSPHSARRQCVGLLDAAESEFGEKEEPLARIRFSTRTALRSLVQRIFPTMHLSLTSSKAANAVPEPNRRPLPLVS